MCCWTLLCVIWWPSYHASLWFAGSSYEVTVNERLLYTVGTRSAPQVLVFCFGCRCGKNDISNEDYFRLLIFVTLLLILVFNCHAFVGISTYYIHVVCSCFLVWFLYFYCACVFFSFSLISAVIGLLLQYLRNCVIFVATVDVVLSWYRFVCRKAVASCLSEFSAFASVLKCPFPSNIKPYMFIVDVYVSYSFYAPLCRIFYTCCMNACELCCSKAVPVRRSIHCWNYGVKRNDQTTRKDA